MGLLADAPVFRTQLPAFLGFWGHCADLVVQHNKAPLFSLPPLCGDGTGLWAAASGLATDPAAEPVTQPHRCWLQFRATITY